MACPFLTLNTGAKMPVLGLGTWKSEPGEVTEAVKNAIDAGYRHIDCAYVYGNEPEIGVALKSKLDDGTVSREDLFLTTKLWNTYHSKPRVVPALKCSLKNLQVDYVDLFLMHWPMGYKEGGDVFPKDADGNWLFSDVDFTDTWAAMEECVDLGLCKAIGFSNFNHEQVERVLSIARIKPSNLQVECHPYNNQNKLIEYCKGKGIVFTAYSPLGSPKRVWAKPDDKVLMDEEQVVALAKKYGKTPAQVLIRFQIQRGLAVLAKSVTKSRIESNFQVFDFEISGEDIAKLCQLEHSERLLHLTWVSHHPFFPFHAEF